MLPRPELKKISRARLGDAMALLKANRFDGAVYLCGYAVELALKERICRTLKWEEFPDSRGEFKDYQSLRTHNLDTLLRFSGRELHIKTNFSYEWDVVAKWNPEARYKLNETVDGAEAEEMISSSKVLMAKL